jgi:hypothetical protein
VNGQRCRAEVDLKQGVAAIDEQSPARGECRCDSGTRLHAGLRLTSVECAHADREREVEQPLAGWQFEVLDGDLADAQPAGRDLRRGVLLGEGYPGGRPVDDEDVTVADPPRHGSGGGAPAPPARRARPAPTPPRPPAPAARAPPGPPRRREATARSVARGSEGRRPDLVPIKDGLTP